MIHWFIKAPCAIMLSVITLSIICIVLVGVYKIAEMAPDTDRDFLVWSDKRTINYDMYFAALEELSMSTGDSEVPLRTQKMSLWDFLVIYECSMEGVSECDNVFSPENLRTIKAHVGMIRESTYFHEICFATSVENPACSSESLLNIADILELYGLNIEAAT